MRDLILLSLLLTTTFSFGAESSALINKALDEQVKLDIDRNLPAAMDQITEQTGVRIKADPIIWDLLPWGRDTKIQARIENVTLRQAMEVMTRKLGLTFALRDEYVEILPMPALRRFAQRASRSELLTLDLLASRQLNLNTTRPSIRQLLEAVDLQLAAEKDVQIAVETRVGDAVNLDRTVYIPRNATMIEALESLPKESSVTWYPWGNNVLIVTKADRTRRLLSKQLTFHAGDQGFDLMQLLLDLSQRTGVPFEFQPGAIASVPAEARTLRGADGRAPVLDNVPAQQILEAITAATALVYSIQDGTVLISAPAAPAAQRDRMIGIIQLDNGMQVLVPSSEVPPDMREYLRQQTRKQLDNIRARMVEEGFQPTTQPATLETERRDDL